MSILATSTSTIKFREQYIVRSQQETPLILVVDDDRATRMLLKLAMEEEGYRVIEAKDGEQCLAAFTRSRPDMVLLDAIMPEMDGFTCCRQLREVPGNEHTPILIITALDDRESIDRAFEAGATDYITKPIYWAVLAQRVLRLLTTSNTLSEYEKLNRRTNQQQRWQQLSLKIARQLSQPFELRQLFNATVSELRTIAGVERIVLYQQSLPRAGRRLLFESVAPGYASIEPLSLENLGLETQYQGQYQQGQVVIINSLDETKSEVAIAQWNQLSIQAALIVPIIVQQQVWGLLCVHQCQTVRNWESWEIEQFSYLGSLLAGSIYQAQLRQQISMR
jgi:DNA-binding response OmpR family regulator